MWYNLQFSGCCPNFQENKIDCFFLNQSNFINRLSLAILFNIGLWTAHQIFLDKTFNNIGNRMNVKYKLTKNLKDVTTIIIKSTNWPNKNKKIIKDLCLVGYFNQSNNLATTKINPSDPRTIISIRTQDIPPDPPPG